jgi:hypothetical protein
MSDYIPQVVKATHSVPAAFYGRGSITEVPQ